MTPRNSLFAYLVAWHFLDRWGLLAFVALEDSPPPDPGPSGPTSPRLHLWAEATCLCGARILLRLQGPRPLAIHVALCGTLHLASGRGDALATCGDVEENPGPQHGTSQEAREILLHILGADTDRSDPEISGALLAAAAVATQTSPPLASDMLQDPPEVPPRPSRTAKRSPASGLNAQQDAIAGPLPPPQVVIPSDFVTDLAHGGDLGQAPTPRDAAGHPIRICTARPPTQWRYPHPTPFCQLLSLRPTTIRHVPACLQGEMSAALAGAISRYGKEATTDHLFAVL